MITNLLMNAELNAAKGDFSKDAIIKVVSEILLKIAEDSAVSDEVANYLRQIPSVIENNEFDSSSKEEILHNKDAQLKKISKEIVDIKKLIMAEENYEETMSCVYKLIEVNYELTNLGFIGEENDVTYTGNVTIDYYLSNINSKCSKSANIYSKDFIYDAIKSSNIPLKQLVKIGNDSNYMTFRSVEEIMELLIELNFSGYKEDAESAVMILEDFIERNGLISSKDLSVNASVSIIENLSDTTRMVIDTFLGEFRQLNTTDLSEVPFFYNRLVRSLISNYYKEQFEKNPYLANGRKIKSAEEFAEFIVVNTSDSESIIKEFDSLFKHLSTLNVLRYKEGRYELGITYTNWDDLLLGAIKQHLLGPNAICLHPYEYAKPQQLSLNQSFVCSEEDCRINFVNYTSFINDLQQHFLG